MGRGHEPSIANPDAADSRSRLRHELCNIELDLEGDDSASLPCGVSELDGSGLTTAPSPLLSFRRGASG
jgi:hypothetical protein